MSYQKQSNATITLRKATPSDAAERAVLDDLASGGFTSYLWQSMVGPGKADTALSFGRACMQEETGPYGWENCTIAEADGEVAGMLTAYELQPMEFDDIWKVPALEPIFDLMAEARGDWLISAIAIHPEWRRNGIAAKLMEDTLKKAEAAGCEYLSLIAASDNTGALALYERYGFKTVAERDFVKNDGKTEAGKQHLLMRRAAQMTS